MANKSDSGRKDCVDGKVGGYNTEYHKVPEFPYETTCEIQESPSTLRKPCVFMDSGELSKNEHIMQCPCCFECQRQEGAKMTRMLLQLWDSVCHGSMTVWDRVSLCYMSVIFMSHVKRMNDLWQDTLEFASLSA